MKSLAGSIADSKFLCRRIAHSASIDPMPTFYQNKMKDEILIIPDVHGRKFWRIAEKEVEEYEHIVFLGDYLDPYPEERIFIEDAFSEFLDILELKRRYPDKITLLLGNHDLHYLWAHDMCSSRRDEEHVEFLRIFFEHHRKHFQLAYECSYDDKTYLFTHAGVLKGWLSYNSATYQFSTEWLNDMLYNVSAGILNQVSIIRGGYEPCGSPIWADVHEHLNSDLMLGVYQIFGHSQQIKDPIITKHWACLDCRKPFKLSQKSGELTTIE